MKHKTTIRILEKDNNSRGDLFGRLMADLFVALGYEQPRLNIHKSGRELDLSAEHRLEPRRAIAECKATKGTIGGDDINKFVGTLDVEQDGKRPVTGYFISLSGFKETAIEQERQRQHTKIIMLTGSQVVSELVQGRILIPKDRATELAGRCCSSLDHIILDPEAELLAHERGWIWTVYYTQGKERTHFALIHSDGTPLAQSLSERVIAADLDCGGKLHKLTCLNPAPLLSPNSDPHLAEAIALYAQYIESECGYIQLDGLPADSDVGSRRLNLENLFVPLNLDIMVKAGGEASKKERQSVGTVLTQYQRLALLSAPGGGKSTLIKRLAVAYADNARRVRIDDNLPQRDWLPLFFRCRELRNLARASIAELLDALSQRDPVRQNAAVFRAHMDRELLAGRVLFLIDGLDEITDDGDRAAFVCTLRTALNAYPGTAMVVTSREAGFRHVAAHLAPICTRAVISTLDDSDIRSLCVTWHKEVVGDSEKVRTDAEHLANTIINSNRIKGLAMNPLLLTTLLLVKRWVGSLPTRRAVLYGKAVEVLLMTWNTEGHEPIPEEEALPQLCYVASTMMLNGVQKISRPRLATLLQEARDAMPTELGYVKGTVDQFIHRVEDRSSLLMMSGHDVEDGRLVEFFEFRHLTFQEFLTARAMVEGWHRDRKDNDTLVKVLQPYYQMEEWREVIPLAAVMGGKETEPLIQSLTEKVSNLPVDRVNNKSSLLIALVNCLADEAAARPETIRGAIRELVRLGSSLNGIDSVMMLATGRYGVDFRGEAGKILLSINKDVGNPGDALLMAIRGQILKTGDQTETEQSALELLEMLNSVTEISRCEGALGIGALCHRILEDHADISICTNTLQCTGPILVDMLFSDVVAIRCTATYALESLVGTRSWIPTTLSDVIDRLFILWRRDSDSTVRQLSARAIAAHPLVPRDKCNLEILIPFEEFEREFQRYDQMNMLGEKQATLISAYYLRALNDAEIAQRASKLKEPFLNQNAYEQTRLDLQKLIDAK